MNTEIDDRPIDAVAAQSTKRKAIPGKTGKVIARGKWIELRDNSPHWQMVFSRFGQRISKTSGTGNKREAEKMAKLLREEKEDQHVRIHGKRGVPTKQRDARLLDAVDWLWENHGRHDVGADDTKRRLFNLVDLLGPDTRLSEITDERVMELIASLEKRDRYGDVNKGKWSDDRVNAHVKTLRRLMLSAVGDRKFYLPDMPNWPRHTLPDIPRTREASIQELDTITHRWRLDTRPALLFLFESGLRRRNAIELTWDQVDWLKQVIRIRVKAPKDGVRRKHRDHERNRKEREIPITPVIAEILKNQMGKHETAVFTYTAKKSFRVPSTGRQLLRGQHYRLTAVTFKSQWRDLIATTEIKNLRIHDLRRTRGSWLYRATGDLKLVKEFLHHSNIWITDSTYAHVAPGQVAAGMMRVAIYEAEMRARWAAMSPDLQADDVGSAEATTELDPSKGLNHCQDEVNSLASPTPSGSAISIEDTRVVLRRLELSPRFHEGIFPKNNGCGVKSGNAQDPGRAGNRVVPNANCRKFTEANSAFGTLANAPAAGDAASCFERSCEPYMNDPAFLGSFIRALDRCFAAATPAQSERP